MKASDLFIKCLEEEGVEYIFGIPGEENLDILESIRKSKIKLVVTRHEQAAGFMAATVGRLTGKTGVCLSTLGPGATNLVTPAAYAYLGGMPMLMITGQKPIKDGGQQGKFQILDIVNMMAPITKSSCQVASGNNIPHTVRNAFRIAEEEMPGPVHIELPEDIAIENTAAKPFSRDRVRRPIAEEKAIAKAVDMIESAKHPLILIGSGANRKRASKMLKELAEKTKIPFFNTQMGKGVLDERDPLFLGTAALSSKDYLHCAIKKADLIINVGYDVFEKPPFLMKDGLHVIHVNFYSAEVDRVYFPQLEVIGDIANAIWHIKEKITSQKHWDFSYFMEKKGILESHLKKKENDSSFPLLPQRIVSDVRKAMPDEGILCLDNGMYKIWFARNYKAHGPNTILLDNALATMGAGLPSAMAARLLNPDKKVLAVCGDGGFMMNSQEIETAVRLGLNIVILILEDNAYGMIKWKQDMDSFERFGLDFKNPDFVKYAESYGAKGFRVESADKLIPTLDKAFSEKGPVIVVCPIDYSENAKEWGMKLDDVDCK